MICKSLYRFFDVFPNFATANIVLFFELPTILTQIIDKKALKKRVFEFFDVEKPVVGSFLIMSEKLLDRNYEGFSQPYSFEPYMEYNDKQIAPVEGEEFVVLKDSNKNIIMKRIYG